MSNFFESLSKVVVELNAVLAQVANKSVVSSTTTASTTRSSAYYNYPIQTSSDDETSTIMAQANSNSGDAVVIPSLLINNNNDKIPPPVVNKAARYILRQTSSAVAAALTTQAPSILEPKFLLITNNNNTASYLAGSNSSEVFQAQHNHQKVGWEFSDFETFLHLLVPNDLGLFEILVHILLLVMCFVIGGITVFLNGVVLRCFVKESSVRTPSNLFIMALAATDLTIGLVSLPLYTMYLILEERWPFGETSCDIWLVMDYTLCLVSQYTVFAITVDRFFSVKYPAVYHRWLTQKRAITAVAAIWIFSAVIFGSTIVGWQYFVGQRTVPPDQCYVQFMTSPFFNMIFVIGYFWSTLIVIIVLYAQIVGVVYQRSQRTRRITEDTLKTLRSNIAHHHRLSSDEKSAAAKTTLIGAIFSRLFKQQTTLMTSSQNSNSSSNKTPIISSVNSPNSENGGGLLLRTSWTGNGSVKTTTTAEQSIIGEELTPAKRMCVMSPNNGTTTSNSDVTTHEEEDDDDDEADADDEEPISGGENNVKGNNNNENNVKSSAEAVSLLAVEKLGENRFTSSGGETVNNRSSMIYKQLLNFRRARDRGARRTFLMISLILGVFILTWSPYHILAIVKGFCDDCVSKSFYNLTYWFCYLNSPINPICYALLNKKIRDAFYRVLHIKKRSAGAEKNSTLRHLIPRSV